MDEIEAMLRQSLADETRQELSFPLTAVVAHQEAKRALILSLINPGLNLLIYGESGLGKKTMLMSASNFLPDVKSTGCPFNCDPNNKILMCTDCRNGGWVERSVKRPFVLLPYTINREMLLGTEDTPYSSVLGSANRGILAIRDLENYSEEIIDTIFSAFTRKKVELGSYTYPSFFQPIATYNGNPGSIRERFVLKVRVEEVSDIEERIEISRRVEMFRKDPYAFYNAYGKEEERLRTRIEEGRNMLRKISVPEKVSLSIRKRVEEYGMKKEYERRIIIASTANAAYEGRIAVTEEDVREVAKLILPLSEP